MSIIFSYPPIGKNDVQPSDRLLLSQMTVDGNPTRSVTVNTFRQYLGAIIPTNIVTGTGTTNRLTKWRAPVGSGIIEDSGIEDTGSEINTPYKLNINNATSNANGIVFPHPAGGASGIVNMYYNGAAAGSRFVISRAATGGAEIELQSNGDVNINRLGNGNFLVGGEVTLDDYGAGTITGTPTFNLEVDANGKIIETASGGGAGIGGTGTIDTLPVFTAATTIGDSIYSQNAGATIGTINGERLVLADATATKVDLLMNTSLNPGDETEINSQGVQFMLHELGSNILIGPNDDIRIKELTPLISMDSETEFNADVSTNFRLEVGGVLDLNDDVQCTGITGLVGDVLTSQGAGNAPKWTTPPSVTGYKSLQVFQWINGTPTAYVNYPIGAAPAFLPFDPTPQIETGTYSGTAAAFAWTCANVAAGIPSPTPVEAEFTLGASGAGSWEVKTCQHWFDQNQFLEVNISFSINGTVVDVIDQRVNDGAGDRIYNGYLFREFSAGDVLKVRVAFANGTGSNPFPSDANNRPIEISFNKIV